MKILIITLSFGLAGSFVIWGADPCYYHPYQDLTWFQGQYPFCQSRSGELTLQPLPVFAFVMFGIFGGSVGWEITKNERKPESTSTD